MSILPISLLIPTMNRPQALRRTLQTYFAANDVPAEVIVVDQSADAATIAENRAVVQAYDGETMVQYLHSDTPSLTKARNIAWQAASNEILVFSDDDVDVYPDTLTNVCSFMQGNHIALIAATDDNASYSRQSILGYLTGVRSFRKRKIGHVTNALFGRFPLCVGAKTPTEWAMGFFFAVRRSLIEKWALGWDENLTSYAYAEDLDFSMAYCKKAKAEGYECILSDRVHVAHLATKEYRIPTRKNTFMYVINRAYLCQKHHLGIRCELAMRWADFCRLAEMILKKRQWRDLRDAMKAAKRNREAIIKGDLAGLYE